MSGGPFNSKAYYAELREKILAFLKENGTSELEPIRAAAGDDSHTIRSQLDLLVLKGLVQRSKKVRVGGTFKVKYRLKQEKSDARPLDSRAAS